MLKRQRPATPPPSSLDDLSLFLPNGPTRLSQPIDSSEPHAKRQRTQPPPLDGAQRGWLGSESAGSRWESDGEEDWIEDPQTLPESPSPSMTTASQYKDANSLLHELHVLNQHRLLFAYSPRDQHLNPSSSVLAHTYMQDPTGRRQTAGTDESPCHPAAPQPARDERTVQNCCIGFVGEKGLVEEVHCVRQRYEGANRLLGSLFLTRRRVVEGMISPGGPS